MKSKLLKVLGGLVCVLSIQNALADPGRKVVKLKKSDLIKGFVSIDMTRSDAENADESIIRLEQEWRNEITIQEQNRQAIEERRQNIWLWQVQLNPLLINGQIVLITTQNEAPNYPEYSMWLVRQQTCVVGWNNRWQTRWRIIQHTLRNQVQNNRNNRYNNHWVQQEGGRWTLLQNNQD